MEVIIDITLLALLAVTSIAILRIPNLFAVVMLAGIYSLLSAGLFTVMDAVDVAFTEAAVGAGISTVLMLATLALVGSKVKTPQLRITDLSAKVPTRRPKFPLVVVLVTGSALVYGTLDMPPYGEATNPVHQHVAPRYLEESGEEVGIPNVNVVTFVLASYRGFDTFGETTVVFTAAIGVMILLSALRGRDKFGEEGWGEEGVPTSKVGYVYAFWTGRQEEGGVNERPGNHPGGHEDCRSDRPALWPLRPIPRRLRAGWWFPGGGHPFHGFYSLWTGLRSPPQPTGPAHVRDAGLCQHGGPSVRWSRAGFPFPGGTISGL